jgi:hypothetical protein
MAISRFSSSRVTQGLPKYQSAWDQDNVEQGAMIPIGSYTIPTIGASFQFSNIPQIYQDLFLTATCRGDGAFAAGGFSAYINATGTTGNSSTILYGTGSSAFSNRATTSTPVFGISFAQSFVPHGTAPAGVFGTVHCHILNYTSTSKFKTSILKGAFDMNGSGHVALAATQWANTAAVSALDIQTNGNWVPGSTFTLYGIKAGV